MAKVELNGGWSQGQDGPDGQRRFPGRLGHGPGWLILGKVVKLLGQDSQVRWIRNYWFSQHLREDSQDRQVQIVACAGRVSQPNNRGWSGHAVLGWVTMAPFGKIIHGRLGAGPRG